MNELAGLVQKVIETGKPQRLSRKKTDSFHARFREEIAPVIEERRRKNRILSASIAI